MAERAVIFPIKSIFVNHLTLKYNNPHIHLEKFIFDNQGFHEIYIKKIKQALKVSKESYVKNYKKKYKDDELPPLWVCVGITTFGEISKLYKNLNIEDRKK